MATLLLSTLILSCWQVISAQVNTNQNDFWTANLIQEGEDRANDCTVSLLSRTPGQKSLSSDVLIAPIDCFSQFTASCEDDQNSLSPDDFTVVFTRYNTSGDKVEHIERGVSEILNQCIEIPYIHLKRPGSATLLRMNESVSSHEGLEPVVLPLSVDKPYNNCLVAGRILKLGDLERDSFNGTPKLFDVQPKGKCENEPTPGDTYYKKVIGGTPIICDGEQGQQLRSMVKLSKTYSEHVDLSFECIAGEDFLNWAKEVLEEEEI